MTNPNNPSDAPDWDAIARYLAGESSAAESVAVRQWLDAHPTDARALAALDAAVRQHVPAGQVDVEAALRRVKTRAARRPVHWAFGVAGLAAAAAVIAVVVLSRSAPSPDRPAAVAETRFSTEPGTRDTIMLPDGTRITLGPSTRLAVSGRDIALEGEAFFTMSSDKSGAYSVKVKDVTIRDIGTEFGVRAYPDEPLKIVVSSGVVEVASPTAKVVLDSGDVGVVTPTGALSRLPGAVTADDVAWMQGRLVFRNASMSQLGEDLRRWYGVQLRVTDTALQRRHFTGSFSGEPVSRVSEVVALALGARAERRGDTIFIRPARR